VLEIVHEHHEGEKTHRFNSTLANLSVGIVEMIIGASSHLIILFSYAFAFEYWAILHWSISPAMWIVGLLAYEFCYYWKHRMGHEVNILWGAHIVHHQSEDMNFSTATRLSATSSLWGVFFYLPIAILGVNPFVFMVVKAVTLAYQFFIHTEHIGRLPAWFEYIFNSPAHHRVHHAQQEQYLDKNYGSLLIIWDRLFNTFADETTQPVYGAIKQIDSWNPIHVNLAYYKQIMYWMKRCRTSRDKFRLIFGRPDSIPAYLINHSSKDRKESVRGDHYAIKKYNAGNHLSPYMKGYAISQFILSLCTAFCLLFYYHYLGWWEIILISCWSLYVLNNLGRLLEGNMESFLKRELIKYLGLAILLCLVLYWGSFGNPAYWWLFIIPIAGILGVLSFRFTLYKKNHASRMASTPF
ncbi:MAG: sterol desaturase family protein, partial [Bacteroidota bacterium]